MKFAKQLEKSAVDEWRSQYFDYKKGKKLLKRMGRECRDPDSSRSLGGDHPALASTSAADTPIEAIDPTAATHILEGFLKAEMQRVDDFYCQKEAGASRRLTQIRVQIREMRDLAQTARQSAEMTRSPSDTQGTDSPLLPLLWQRVRDHARSAIEYADIDLLERHPLRDSAPDASALQLHMNYAVVRRRLRTAIKEFYHSLELLGSFQTLNQTAVSKFLKKAEKAMGVRVKRHYLDWYHRHTKIGQSENVEQLLKETEDLYCSGFFDNRKRALASLRTHVRTEDSRFTMLRVGLMLGSAVPLLLEGLVRSRTDAQKMSASTKSFLLQVFAGYFLVLLAALLFGCSCYIWEVNRISHVFVLEFDIRHNLTWAQIFELPAMLTLLFALFFWMCFSGFFPDFAQYYPLALLVAAVVLLCCPLNIAHRSSRRWLAIALARLILPGVVSVRFQDVFLGDILNSLTYTMGNIPLFFGLYSHDWVNPSAFGSTRSRLFGFFQTLPGIIRLLHCLRRYRDTRHVFPHVYNALKYSSTVLQYAFLSAWRIDRTPTNRALFATFASINTVATISWDVLMDTSLLQRSKKHPLLRDYLSFGSTWPYYLFLVLDPILRCSWIFYLIYQHSIQHAAAVSFFVALAEILRRSMWAVFRVENEHCANVLAYRATRELPLPFAIEVLGEAAAPLAASSLQGSEAPTISQAHAADFSRRRPQSLRSTGLTSNAGATSDEDDDYDDD